MQRLLDLIISLVTLIFLSPLLFCISVLIKFEDRGSIFYKGIRIGKNGDPFRMFKFRTMIVHAESFGASSTANDDPRITRIGKYLRKYKIDEIPQLINVLKGDMALVGPRPEVKKFTDLYNELEKNILSVRPGMTDWASIWNANEGAILTGTDDPDLAYVKLIRPTKIRLQLCYVQENSLFINLRIIFLTLLTVFAPESQLSKRIKKRLMVRALS